MISLTGVGGQLVGVQGFWFGERLVGVVVVEDGDLVVAMQLDTVS